MIRVGFLQVALTLTLVLSLAAEAWCLHDSRRPAERAIGCGQLLTVPDGRYTLTEPCHADWVLGGGQDTRSYAALSFYTTDPEGSVSSRWPIPSRLRLRTRHEGAVHAVRHLRREDATMLRYVARHPQSVWPVGVRLDVESYNRSGEALLILSDPPLPLRDTTIFFALLALVSLLSLLLVAWLKRRWAPRPRPF